mgnify:CR=1 FL=1
MGVPSKSSLLGLCLKHFACTGVAPPQFVILVPSCISSGFSLYNGEGFFISCVIVNVFEVQPLGLQPAQLASSVLLSLYYEDNFRESFHLSQFGENFPSL